MKKLILLVCLVCTAGVLPAQDQLFTIHQKDGTAPSFLTSKMDSVTFSSDQLQMRVHLEERVWDYQVTDIDSLTFSDPVDYVKVIWDGAKVQVINPYENEGVEILTDGAYVTVVSESETKDLIYELQGVSTEGMFKIYSSKKYILRLNGVSLTNPGGPALNSQSGKACTFQLVEGTANYFADAAGYDTASGEGEDQKGTIFSEGQFIFSGSGSLTVQGNNNHAICSDDYILFEEGLGTVTVSYAVNDGIHGKDYTQIDGGTLSVTSVGDAVDAGGYLVLNGGDLNLTVLSDSDKQEGLKADTALTINAGTLVVKNASKAGKCVKSGDVVRIHGGTMHLTNTGTYILESGDISTAAAVKSDGDVAVTGGEITIVNTSSAGKGFNVGGALTMTDGTVTGTLSGAGVSFTNTSNEQDASSSKCLGSDGAMYLLGGTVTSTSSGVAGKGIVSQDVLTIGNATGGPVLNVTTTGAKLVVSGSGGSTNRPGGNRPGGGGDMDNSGGSSPKAIKSMGNLTVNNGTIVAKTSQDGGEGLESKSAMTIHGGVIEATTYDDALNAATNITLNGGSVYAYSSGNDAIDSNGTMNLNGGIVVASGTSNPEGAFDCDNNAFSITGGVIIGTGGSSSTPTSTTQKYLKFSSVSLTSGQIIRLSSSSSTSGTDNVLVYKAPRTLSGATILLSDPALKSGTTYYLFTGATLSSGTETFHGYYENAAATGGTSRGSSSAK